MTKVAFPHPRAPVNGFGGAMGPDWLRFFREWYVQSGLAPDVSIYAPEFHAARLSMAASGTTSEDFALYLGNNQRKSSSVTVSAIWKPSDANAGNVVLQLSQDIVSDGSAPSATTENKTVAAPGVSDQYVFTEFTSFGSDASDKDTVAHLTVSRLGSDAADTYGSAIELIGVVMKRQVDGIGTVVEFENG